MAFVLLKTDRQPILHKCCRVDSFFIKLPCPLHFSTGNACPPESRDEIELTAGQRRTFITSSQNNSCSSKIGCYANNCYDILAFSTGMSCASPENKQFNARIHPAAIAFLSSNPFVPLVNFCINKNEQSTLKCFTILYNIIYYRHLDGDT